MKLNENEFAIIGVFPREKLDYRSVYEPIMKGIVFLIDDIEYDNPGLDYVFIHDGLTAGTLEYGIEAVNKLSPGLIMRNRHIRKNKIAIDPILHGKFAQERWLDSVIESTGDKGRVLIIDDNSKGIIAYAKAIANNPYIVKV